MEGLESALRAALGSIRDVGAKHDALAAELARAEQRAHAWQKRYEAEAEAHASLRNELDATKAALKEARQHLQLYTVASRQAVSALRAQTASRARSQALSCGRPSSLGCKPDVPLPGGLLPLPMARASSAAAANAEPPVQIAPAGADALPGASLLAELAAASSGAGAPEGGLSPVPPELARLARGGTVSISGLLSMLMTVNLLRNDSSPGAATTAPTPARLPPTAADQQSSGEGSVHGEAHGAGAGPAAVYTRSEPGLRPAVDVSVYSSSFDEEDEGDDGVSGPITARSGRGGRATRGRHTITGGGASSSVVDGGGASVSLVDDDGTSGVGLAAAAAVAAAAARAWAAAASQQQKRSSVHAHRGSTASFTNAAAAAATDTAPGAATDLVLASQSSSGLSLGSSTQPHGRRPGKAGYKLVASMYREPASAVIKPPTLIRPHAASAQNVAALDSGTPGSSGGRERAPQPPHHAASYPVLKSLLSATAANASPATDLESSSRTETPSVAADHDEAAAPPPAGAEPPSDGQHPATPPIAIATAETRFAAAAAAPAARSSSLRASQLLGAFTVQEPDVTPGGHLSHIPHLPVGHAVPARVHAGADAPGTTRRSLEVLLPSGGEGGKGHRTRSPSPHALERRAGLPRAHSPAQAAAASSPFQKCASLPCTGGHDTESQLQAASPAAAPPPPATPAKQREGPGMQQQLALEPTVAVMAAPAAPAVSPLEIPDAATAAATLKSGVRTGVQQVAPGSPLTKSTALTLHWLSPPRTALVVCKLAPPVYALLNQVLRWLRDHSLSVYVEPAAFPHVEPCLLRTGIPCPPPDDVNGGMNNAGSPSRGSEASGEAPGPLPGVLTWPEGRCPTNSIPDEVAQDLDFVVVLGGDGTLLWTCHVFGNRAVPPLLPFNMGSLGFLTPFPPAHVDEMLGLITRGGFPMILRHRLHATIVRAPGGPAKSAEGDVCWADGHCATEKVVLNEVVVDRGISPFLTNLECYCDGNFVTHVQGDGLIISTPTGSTAYSLAAGGSMVHPQVPGVLFTPVCPHSLSFRPLVFPDHVELSIQVPHGARATMYCSFDGKDREELNAGDAIIIRISQWPIPTVCSPDPSRDWFTGVREGLHWNERRVQAGAGA